MDIGFFISGLIFSILGLLGLLGLLAQWDIFYRERGWPSIKGTIQTSRVKIEDKGEDDNGNPILLYRPEIVYHYQIEERAYVVREPIYNAVYDKQSAEKFVAAYPIGKQINVFYNPQKPQESTLKTGFKIEWSFLVASFILLAVGVLCIWRAFTSA